jgi:hypothetical protein
MYQVCQLPPTVVRIFVVHERYWQHNEGRMYNSNFFRAYCTKIYEMYLRSLKILAYHKKKVNYVIMKDERFRSAI